MTCHSLTQLDDPVDADYSRLAIAFANLTNEAEVHKSGGRNSRVYDTRAMNDATGSEIVGLVAGFGTTFAVVPDLVKMIRRQSSQGLSPVMPVIMAVFQVVWLYYGVLIGSRPVVLWNVVAVCINTVSVVTYVHFARREKSR
jgi:uncharacterized protein with PQ loop repeat